MKVLRLGQKRKAYHRGNRAVAERTENLGEEVTCAVGWEVSSIDDEERRN